MNNMMKNKVHAKFSCVASLREWIRNQRGILSSHPGSRFARDSSPGVRRRFLSFATTSISSPWFCRFFLFFIFNQIFIKGTFAADKLPYQEVSLTTLITNLAQQLPQVWLLVTALSYVFGFFFVVEGILKMKKFAEQRSMMSTEASMRGPLLWLFVGAAMIYLPSSLNAGLTTFWLNPNPFGYENEIKEKWRDLYNACIYIVQLVGLIAFIRGLFILVHLGQQGGQPQFGRAMAHIIGGIFLIDLYDTLQMIYATFGLQGLWKPTNPTP